jgi:cytochrome b561
MTDSSTQNHYDRLTIAIHWLTAALVISLWLIGQLVDFVPRGPVRMGIWSTHVVLGFTLCALLIVRIVWKLTAARKVAPANIGLMGHAAKLGHLALYGLLIAVVALGLADAFVRGFNIFNIVTLPTIGDASLRRPINGWHELAANAIAALALLHALVALFHQYVLKDQLLGRMGIGRA